MTTLNLTKLVKERARELGFDLVGIAPADSHDHFSFFEKWLKKGYAGTMEWLARNKEKRGDPQKVLEGAKSLICVGLNYHRGHPRSVDCREEGRGWISNYAWGDDYHGILLEKLGILEEFIRSQALRLAPSENRGARSGQARMKSYVDTGPILERSYAASAGLGWIGKNTCLINKDLGSFFLSARSSPILN